MRALEAVQDAGWLLVMGLTVPIGILVIGSAFALAGHLVLWVIALL